MKKINNEVKIGNIFIRTAQDGTAPSYLFYEVVKIDNKTKSMIEVRCIKSETRVRPHETEKGNVWVDVKPLIGEYDSENIRIKLFYGEYGSICIKFGESDNDDIDIASLYNGETLYKGSYFSHVEKLHRYYNFYNWNVIEPKNFNKWIINPSYYVKEEKVPTEYAVIGGIYTMWDKYNRANGFYRIFGIKDDNTVYVKKLKSNIVEYSDVKNKDKNKIVYVHINPLSIVKSDEIIEMPFVYGHKGFADRTRNYCLVDKNNEMKGFRFDNSMSRWNVAKVSELDTKF